VPHLNFGKFIDILRIENERVRVSLIQARLKIEMSDKDYKKEEKLRLVVNSYFL
jgi:hypothetical protein